MVMKDATPLTPPSAWAELIFKCKQIEPMIPSVSRDTTWQSQLEVIQTNGSTCYHNIPFGLLEINTLLIKTQR